MREPAKDDHDGREPRSISATSERRKVVAVPHGSLPPVPILVLPTDLVAELVADGLATPSPNPAAQFSAGDWWSGVLMVTGAVSDAITLTTATKAGIEAVAGRLHHWNHQRRTSPTPDDQKPCQLVYRTTKGRALLDLDEQPALDILQRWLEVAYATLAEDAQHRQ